jgi:hypothetical protein
MYVMYVCNVCMYVDRYVCMYVCRQVCIYVCVCADMAVQEVTSDVAVSYIR